MGKRKGNGTRGDDGSGSGAPAAAGLARRPSRRTTRPEQGVALGARVSAVVHGTSAGERTAIGTIGRRGGKSYAQKKAASERANHVATLKATGDYVPPMVAIERTVAAAAIVWDTNPIRPSAKARLSSDALALRSQITLLVAQLDSYDADADAREIEDAHAAIGEALSAVRVLSKAPAARRMAALEQQWEGV